MYDYLILYKILVGRPLQKLHNMNVEEIKEDISGVINDNGIKAKQYSSYVTFLNNYRWYIAAFGTVLTLGLVFYAFTINSALSSGGKSNHKLL